MNWKESKLVGVVALLLVIAAVVAIVLFAKSQTGGGPYEYYLCDSTGELFKVRAVPSNEDYMQNYVGVPLAAPAPCKICGKVDAFRAEKTPSGKWLKIEFGYFVCDSTGEMFNVPAEPDLAEYDGEFFENPGEPVKCLVCGKDDAYMVRLDSEGNWIRVKPGEALEPEEELPPGEEAPEVTGEEVGWDAIVQREAEKRGEEPVSGEEMGTEGQTEAVPAGDSETSEESPQEIEDTGTDSETLQQ